MQPLPEKIQFQFEGTTYELDSIAVQYHAIKLPDDRHLFVESWTWDGKPCGLRLLTDKELAQASVSLSCHAVEVTTS